MLGSRRVVGLYSFIELCAVRDGEVERNGITNGLI